MSRTGIDTNLRADVSSVDWLERTAGLVDDLGLAAGWVLADADADADAGDPGGGPDRDARVRRIPVLGPPAAHPGIVARARAHAAHDASRVVGLRPARDGYPLADWVLSPLPELCEREQLTLILDYVGAPIPWLEIVPFARCYPGLPMLLLGASVGGDEVAPSALDAAANLVLGVGRLGAPDDLVRLVEVFGSQRFAYASATSTSEQGATRLRELRAARLDHDAEHGVLAGTAAALAEGRYAGAFL